MELTFRKATANDSEACVPLMHSAAPELQEYLFSGAGKTAKEYLAHEFKNGGGFFGHRNHTVAVLNNEVVGCAAFCSEQTFEGLDQAAFKNMLGYFGLLRVIPVILRARFVDSVKPAADTIYIANLGVTPDKRSYGIGSALIRHGITDAKSKGFAKMSLDVAKNNPRAETLYQRLGFQFVHEKEFRNKKAGIPNSRYYVLPIA
jgi:ribosomal protein S18 acetylase RimI-like enzyme